MNTVGRSYVLITSGPGFSKGPRYFETVVFFFFFFNILHMCDYLRNSKSHSIVF